MKYNYLFGFLLLCFPSFLFAQSWSTTGNAGINTTTNYLGTKDTNDLVFRTRAIERGRVSSAGVWRFGTATNYVSIDAAGSLSFAGTAAYKVTGNKYAFQFAGNPNYGLFFNSSQTQYEFRNGSAVPVFYINANNGNSVFSGNLKVGAYTLPATDGSSGQVLKTNGSGILSWSGDNGAAYTAGTGIGISGTTITNTAPDKTVTVTGSGATTVTGTYPNFTISSTNNNTTYTAGAGISISGNVISNTASETDPKIQTSALNAVPKWNGTALVDGSIYDNGNIGIGTTSPQQLLTVQSTAGYAFGVTDGSSLLSSFVNGDLVQFGTKTNQSFQLMANDGLDQFVLTPEGKVGIGTALPAAMLDVQGDAKARTLTIGSSATINKLTVSQDANIHGLTAGTGPSNNIQNTAFGAGALQQDTTGGANVAIGYQSLSANTTGNQNTGVGYQSLLFNTSGSANTANGYSALPANTTGYNNTASGTFAMRNNTTGYGNTALGRSALSYVTTGNYNTCVGYADYPLTDGIFNYTGIGYLTGSSASSSNMVELGNSDVTVIRGAVNFSTYSDERIKNNIKNNVPGLSFINLLKPVTYKIDLDKEAAIVYSGKQKEEGKTDYAGKNDLAKQLKTGFLAQEVEAAAKKLNYDFSGVVRPQNEHDLYSLRYSEFVVPLVKAVQELSRQNDSLKSAAGKQQQVNDDLQKQIDDLKASLVPGKTTAAADDRISTQTVELKGTALLEQNVPNPFTNTTVIKYYLPVNAGNAYLSFYGVNGTVLKTIRLSGNGNGSVTLKASELPAGAYRYSLLSDGKIIDTKQMVLAR